MNRELVAVVFDMDGVLIDTPKYGWKSITRVISSQGIVLEPSEITHLLGRPLVVQHAYIVEKYQIHNFDYGTFKELYDAEIEQVLKSEPVTALKGVKHLIGDLRNNNVKIAVGTSSTKDRSKRLLKMAGLDNLFDAVITMEDVSNYKPDPEIFIKTALAAGGNPSNSVVIEDAANGIEAARRGGFPCIGVLSAFQQAVDLADANLLIYSHDELNYEKIRSLL